MNNDTTFRDATQLLIFSIDFPFQFLYYPPEILASQAIVQPTLEDKEMKESRPYFLRRGGVESGGRTRGKRTIRDV